MRKREREYIRERGKGKESKFLRQKSKREIVKGEISCFVTRMKESNVTTKEKRDMRYE